MSFVFTACKHVSALVTLTGLSLVVLAMLMPNIEQGRTEARVAQTIYDVRRIHRSYESSLSETGHPPEADADSTPINDVWGMPYEVKWDKVGERFQISVRSGGPDEMLNPNRSDSDDIFFGMPKSPLEPYRKSRFQQWIVAFVISGGLWLGLIWLYFRKPGRSWSD